MKGDYAKGASWGRQECLHFGELVDPFAVKRLCRLNTSPDDARG